MVWVPRDFLKFILSNSFLKGSGLNEHLLIREYFSDIGSDFLSERYVSLGVGDDAAGFKPPKGYEIILSTDTSIEDVHFLSTQSPDDIAYRAVAVALSDLAACGADPAWFMVSLTMNENKSSWLKKFSKGLNQIAHEYRIPLIGGDTTRGPLIITVQVGGIVKSGKMITRSGAKNGDLIYVSGKIGEAYLGLHQLKDNLSSQEYIHRYIRPIPRFDLSKILLKFASSAIDISDGLVQDLEHLCTASKVGAKINIDQIPFPLNSSKEDKRKFISSGDDYQLCFTIPKKERDILKKQDKKIDIKEIGYITNEENLIIENENKQVINVAKGYSHF